MKTIGPQARYEIHKELWHVGEKSAIYRGWELNHDIAGITVYNNKTKLDYRITKLWHSKTTSRWQRTPIFNCLPRKGNASGLCLISGTVLSKGCIQGQKVSQQQFYLESCYNFSLVLLLSCEESTPRILCRPTYPKIHYAEVKWVCPS